MRPKISLCMMTSSNGNIFRVTGLLCGNSPVTAEVPSQRPVTRSFEFFFDLRQNKRLSKQLRLRWFESPLRSLWRHFNGLSVSDHPHHNMYFNTLKLKGCQLPWSSLGTLKLAFNVLSDEQSSHPDDLSISVRHAGFEAGLVNYSL